MNNVHIKNKKKKFGKTIELYRTKFYHFTDDKPYISNNSNRLIPNSLSVSASNEGSVFGRHKYLIIVDKNAKVLEVDIHSDEWYDLKGKNFLEKGKTCYDYAIKNNYDIIKVMNVFNVGTEYDILNKNVILKVEKINV